jgi:hypothetical protein
MVSYALVILFFFFGRIIKHGVKNFRSLGENLAILYGFIPNFGIKIHSKKCRFFGCFLWACKESNNKNIYFKTKSPKYNKTASGTIYDA